MDFPRLTPSQDLEIAFTSADIDFQITDKARYQKWITEIIVSHGVSATSIHYVFCSDDYLIDINRKYLRHNTFTDIITFPLSTNPIESEIYISIDRIRENSIEMCEDFDRELQRVMAHGILHLLGYGDKTEKEIAQMRLKEDECINRFYLE